MDESGCKVTESQLLLGQFSAVMNCSCIMDGVFKVTTKYKQPTSTNFKTVPIIMVIGHKAYTKGVLCITGRWYYFFGVGCLKRVFTGVKVSSLCPSEPSSIEPKNTAKSIVLPCLGQKKNNVLHCLLH